MLSKSKYLKGLQCPKHLYLYTKHPDLMDPVSPSLYARFKRGTEAGVLAQQKYPGGRLITESGEIPGIEAARRTAEAIEEGERILYEAVFIAEDVLVAVDILAKGESGWRILEVKSSTDVSDVHIPDAAIQYFALSRCGLKIEDAGIVHVDTKYIRKGNIEPGKLFKETSMLDRVLPLQANIPGELDRFRQILEQHQAPDIPIGPYCEDPYACAFKGHCWSDVPHPSVFDIGGMRKSKKFELYHGGIQRIEDIADDYPLNASQRLQVDAWNSGETTIHEPAIREILSTLRYPLYYLDFEAMYDLIIPMYDQSRPYQQIPFQYSLHIQDAPGAACEHREFLAEPHGDPRKAFIADLLGNMGNSGSIVVYNENYEKTRLKEIAWDFPEHAQPIENLLERFFDLMPLFRSKHYYTPELLGSYSIKDVLPSLVPELSYDSLEIREGSAASETFLSMVNGEDLGKPYQALRTYLLSYCEMDTWAMVRLLGVLEDV